MIDQELLKYPIGRPNFKSAYTQLEIEASIAELADFPTRLLAYLKTLPESKLENTYREGSWNIRQIVHHLVDSHLHSYTRFKLALTETVPIIKAYDQDTWVETDDAKGDVIEAAEFLVLLHSRMVNLLNSFTPEDYKRAYFHPERKKLVDMEENIILYAWHGKHHLEQIKIAASN